MTRSLAPRRLALLAVLLAACAGESVSTTSAPATTQPAPLPTTTQAAPTTTESGPTDTTAGAVKPCDKNDMQRLVDAGAQAALSNDSKGLGGLWTQCQIRLYDSNDDEDNPDNPEVPDVYTDKEYFLVGIFIYEPYKSADRPDLERAALIDLTEAGTTRMFWGTAATPDSDLDEIELIETHYQDAMHSDLGLVVYNHRYHIFEPGSLAPGEYKWRYEEEFPGFDPFVAWGSVVIIDA